MKPINVTLALLLAWIPPALADVEIIQRGYYQVMNGDEQISQHSSYRKALQAAVNHAATELTIEPPTVTVTKDQRDIELSWKPPEQRENGEDLAAEEIDHYRLYYSQAGGSSGSRDLQDNQVTVGIPAGTWSFSVTTIDTKGNESRKTDERTVTDEGIVPVEVAQE